MGESEPTRTEPPITLHESAGETPDIPNTVIGTISSTKGTSIIFTSGNFTGLGTFVVQDLISGKGTSANVNVYNPAAK